MMEPVTDERILAMPVVKLTENGIYIDAEKINGIESLSIQKRVNETGTVYHEVSIQYNDKGIRTIYDKYRVAGF